MMQAFLENWMDESYVSFSSYPDYPSPTIKRLLFAKEIFSTPGDSTMNISRLLAALGVLGLRTYGDVLLENLKCYAVSRS